MRDEQFEKRIADLKRQIADLPQASRDRVEAVAHKAQEDRDKLSHAMAAMQESLDSLRVGLKYVVFDLEATKRENQQLRDRLHKYGISETDDDEQGVPT